ncbi:MAG: isocitrate/isopropylmalate dehydrogenase family protein [archaeon]|nr:isocitrate/isopropylmalate dehydrogenase family protein [archaeon]
MTKYKLAMLNGDGIGPEVVSSARSILETASQVTGLELEFIELPVGLEAYKNFGRTLPPNTIEGMSQSDAWILGPLQTGSYPKDDRDYPMSSGKIRKYFDLFANIRPAKSYIPKVASNIDLVIVRENTEDFFPNINLFKGYGEFWTDKDTVVSLRVIRRSSCKRIAKTAFELARSRNQKKLVTAVHKSNVLIEGDGLFLEEANRVYEEGFRDLRFEQKLIDSASMELVLKPERFDVILATNLFGDIISDEAAGLVGGLGFCPSLNSGEKHAMGQAVHGTAPDIAGKGIANPVSEILSSVMLLDWLFSHKGEERKVYETARVIERAIKKQLSSQDPKDKTLDIDGNASTQEFTSRLSNRILVDS